jgi:hypothetical protein
MDLRSLKADIHVLVGNKCFYIRFMTRVPNKETFTKSHRVYIFLSPQPGGFMLRRRLLVICVLLIAAEARAATLEITSGRFTSSSLLNDSFFRFGGSGFSVQGGNFDPQTFTLNPPPPTLTRLSQWSSGGELEITETLTGTNFVTGATAVQVKGTTGMTVVSEVATSTSIRATFRVARDVKPGTYLVTVTTPAGVAAQPFIVQPDPAARPDSTTARSKTIKNNPPKANAGPKGNPIQAFFRWFS